MRQPAGEGLPCQQLRDQAEALCREGRFDQALPIYKSAVESFEQTMRGYAGLWCCNRPPGGRGAGHIWYDFLHDVVPHRDRFNRKWDEKWFPKMGP